MESANVKRSFLPAIAVIGGIIAIVSLFLYWVNISTTFSYSFFEIPYTLRTTAIKVVEGATDIPDDWHTVCPAVAGVFGIIGLIFAVIALVKPKTRRACGAAMIFCGILAVVFALLFFFWEFTVYYEVTATDAGAVQALAAALAANDIPTASAIITQMGLDPVVVLPQIQAMMAQDPMAVAQFVAQFTAGNQIPVGYLYVKDVVDYGFYLCIAGGLLVFIAGLLCINPDRKQ